MKGPAPLAGPVLAPVPLKRRDPATSPTVSYGVTMADKKKQGAKKQGGKKTNPKKQKGEISMDELGKVSGGMARKGRASKKLP
jgi:hypothetical protein